MNRYFSKEDLQINIIHMKGFSTSLIIREMHVKTTMRYQLTLIRRAIIKKTRKKILEEMWRKGNPCALLVGM